MQTKCLYIADVKIGNFDACQKQLDELEIAVADRYFVQLPKPVATATTDADGKFVLKVPKTGKYFFAAKAQRRIADQTEQYFWLAPTDIGSTDTKVILSNNNLIKTASDSILAMK